MLILIMKRRNEYCIVASCKNTAKSNPNKLFFTVPREPVKRNSWLSAVGKTSYSRKSTLFVCEDHFNVEEDLENYVKFKITGKYKRMKPEIVPHRNIFHRPTSNNCVVSSLDKCASTTTSTTVKLEEETNTKMSPLICIIQPVPSLDNTQPLTSPAKKKLRLILPKSNTGNTSSDADIETTLLPASSTDSTTEAQCSQDSIDSSPNTQMNTISTNTKEEDVNLETDVHHFEEIYIKEEPLEENTSDYEYDNFLQDIKEESDNVNEIDIKEENEIM